MNGLEKITGRIAEDARTRAGELIAEANEQAASISAKYAQRADRLSADLVAEGERQAALKRERLVGAAQLEGRKETLRVKQEVLEETFALAARKLRDMPREEYVEFLARLMAEAATTGREKVVMSAADRSQVGKEAVTLANEKLAKAAAPQLSPELTESKVGAVIDKVVTVGSALLKGTAMLTLSEETRDMAGGFILTDGPVEVNCTLETLLAQEKSRMSGEIAKTLFPG